MTELDTLLAREQALSLPRFNADDAWWLGSYLREAGRAINAPVAIEITLGHTCLFTALLPGATSDNPGWIRRKAAIAWRFQCSSYAMNRKFSAAPDMFERFGLDHATYAAAGGAVPILVDHVGMVGVVGVSGLPQLDDHELVLAALAALQNKQKGEV
ncbi:heme-degrading domain-containing protein [Novosphingobium umbonatum]|uniref:Heme-degrading domain-containing protein n=1 Tax=Novosphingobium umbonatum TaxID=1908524 RepID=A0A3S2VE13_9SPHN|nr:heme-degrading domain-containing protein [Novosphingobium umbonatum]RVU05710.1 heme-degrading domain-containing protein [Novosphingobium umbonatum]